MDALVDPFEDELIEAAEEGDIEEVKRLLESGDVDINAVNKVSR